MAVHLTLRVVSGPECGTSRRLTNRPVVVGRADDCDLIVSDPSLSRRHFELARAGDVWTVRDLGSRNGLSLNGVRTTAGAIAAGDRVLAGVVEFVVEEPRARMHASAGATPAHPSPVLAPSVEGPIELFPETAPTLSAVAESGGSPLLAKLREDARDAATSRLYAVIDGAQDFELAFAARLMGHRVYTLFAGDIAGLVAKVGPCLVELGEPSAFVERFARTCGAHAGIMLETSVSIESMAAHLRHIFVATDESGQEYFFRFYDPRVLRAFLPGCLPDERRELFGPIARMVLESADGATFVQISLGVEGSLLETPVQET